MHAPPILIRHTFRYRVLLVTFFMVVLAVLMFPVIYFIEGPNFNFLATLVAWGITIPLCFGFSYLLGFMFPLVITPVGVEGHTSFGTQKHMVWEEMRDTRTMWFVGLTYVRIASKNGGLPMWMPLFVENKKELIERVAEYAPEDNPLRQYLSALKP